MAARRGSTSVRTARPARWAAVVAAAGLLLAACGGDDDPVGAPATTAPGTGGTAGTTTTVADDDLPEGVSNGPVGQVLRLGEPRRGGEVVVGMENVFLPIDPAAPRPDYQISPAIHGSLIAMSPDGTEFVPAMALGITPDDTATVWTLELRPGITFTDGTPFDAAAVVTNWDRLRDPATKFPFVGNLAPVASYEAVDDLTVRFTLSRPVPAFPELLLGSQPTGMFASPKALAELGANYGRAPVGAGPFMLESWSEQRIVVVRNPDYYLPELPYLDKITFVSSIDSQAELAALEVGDIDIALTQSEPDWERAEGAGIRVLRQNSFTTVLSVFNLEKEPVNDLRVRRALRLAVDDQAIVDTIWAGKREVAPGPVAPAHPFYAPVTGYGEFDPDKARRLIEEYESETGKEVKFTFDTWNPPEFVQMFTIVQQMWAAVGAEVEMLPLSQADLVADTGTGNYVAQSRYGSWRTVPDVTLRNTFHSTGGANLGNFVDPATDAAIDIFVSSTDRDERMRQAAIVQQRLADELPYLWHNIQGQAFYTGEKVKGFPGADPGFSTVFAAELVWV